MQVCHVYQWFLNSYAEETPKTDTLFNCIKTNPGYNGLTHPMKEHMVGDKKMWMPNWGYRYLS